MHKRQYPPNIPNNVIDALDAFTDDELEGLWAIYDDETNEFLGIGFFDEQIGKCTKYTDPEKAAAVEVLDQQYRSEQEIMARQVWLDITDSILMRWSLRNNA